jgi:uncharacterized membrane protein
MTKGRLEAFSDGVFAIIITIMVLELKIPEGHDFKALQPVIPAFLSYVLSFVYVGIYWNNHHHMLQAAGKINGKILWANLHLLFWLSLVPFVTGWMGEHHFASAPLMLYGVMLLMAAIAYWILQREIISENGKDSDFAKAIGRDIKGKISPLIYSVGIACSFFYHWLSGLLYVLVALIWLIPDRRFEKNAPAKK